MTARNASIQFFVTLSLTTLTQQAFAANPRKAKSSSDQPMMTLTPSSGKGAKNFVLLGIGAYNAMAAHAEYNLLGEAGIGIEYAASGQDEMLTKKENDEKKASFKARSQEAVLTIARYSREHLLGGFYWLLGVGYQSSQVKWQKLPEAGGEPRTALLNSEGRMEHRLNASGPTAHGRFGYRFVSEEWPVAIGAFLGFKHFDAAMKDRGEEEEQARALGLTQTTSPERKQARRIMMSTVGLGIEFGFAF